MKINTTTFEELHRPVYILEEAKLRNNLSLISSIAKEADIEIILAFKAYALWKTFPIFREYINATTASSLYETKLGYNEFGAPTHTFSPAYTDYEIDECKEFTQELIKAHNIPILQPENTIIDGWWVIGNIYENKNLLEESK